jgi:hypothetical protein
VATWSGEDNILHEVSWRTIDLIMLPPLFELGRRCCLIRIVRTILEVSNLTSFTIKSINLGLKAVNNLEGYTSKAKSTLLKSRLKLVRRYMFLARACYLELVRRTSITSVVISGAVYIRRRVRSS